MGMKFLKIGSVSEWGSTSGLIFEAPENKPHGVKFVVHAAKPTKMTITDSDKEGRPQQATFFIPPNDQTEVSCVLNGGGTVEFNNDVSFRTRHLRGQSFTSDHPVLVRPPRGRERNRELELMRYRQKKNAEAREAASFKKFEEQEAKLKALLEQQTQEAEEKAAADAAAAKAKAIEDAKALLAEVEAEQPEQTAENADS